MTNGKKDETKLNWVEVDKTSLHSECQKAYQAAAELSAKAAEFREKADALFLKHHTEDATSIYVEKFGKPEGTLRIGSLWGKLSFTFDPAQGRKVSSKAVKFGK